MFRDLKNIFSAIARLGQALKLTGRYLCTSMQTSADKHRDVAFLQDSGTTITLQYPAQTLPVPDRGRYKLHNEIEECIVCNKCARVCPVDCIEIEGIPAPAVIGETRNGMPKRIHPARFDIDMAKCCFCGLCTTVCPTDCLTMTPVYDFSVFDVLEHKVSFAHMSETAIADAKQVWEGYRQAVNNT